MLSVSNRACTGGDREREYRDHSFATARCCTFSDVTIEMKSPLWEAGQVYRRERWHWEHSGISYYGKLDPAMPQNEPGSLEMGGNVRKPTLILRRRQVRQPLLRSGTPTILVQAQFFPHSALDMSAEQWGVPIQEDIRIIYGKSSMC